VQLLALRSRRKPAAFLCHLGIQNQVPFQPEMQVFVFVETLPNPQAELRPSFTRSPMLRAARGGSPKASLWPWLWRRSLLSEAVPFVNSHRIVFLWRIILPSNRGYSAKLLVGGSDCILLLGRGFSDVARFSSRRTSWIARSSRISPSASTVASTSDCAQASSPLSGILKLTWPEQIAGRPTFRQ